ncbi:MAG: biopolymer transporter ExbD [Bacteroidales bacterium]|nr:biopolymer transporter ExbD [Bacteroidales bacterium]
MALKRSHSMQAAFSMASMTDVIFLLLIFFMVTSTFVFPTALDVNLPQGTQQTPLKPRIRLYVDRDGVLYTALDEDNPTSLEFDALPAWLKLHATGDETQKTAVALYADEAVTYGTIVDVLNAGATSGVKIVLATRPVATSKVKKYLKK